MPIKNKLFIIIPAILILVLALVFVKFGNFFTKKTSAPPKPIQIEIPKVSPKPESLQKGQFSCPSTPDFCKTGADISQNNKYIGFGAKIAQGSLIFASIDGQLTGISATLTNGEKMVVLYIDNKDKGFRASYFFQGDKTPEPKQVKEGDQIGTVGSFLSFYNASLVFSITKNDPVTGDKIKLSSKDFK